LAKSFHITPVNILHLNLNGKETNVCIIIICGLNCFLNALQLFCKKILLCCRVLDQAWGACGPCEHMARIRISFARDRVEHNVVSKWSHDKQTRTQ